MTIQELRAHIARATAIVDSWPEWKRNILANSNKPTVSIPRTPVDNRHRQEQPGVAEKGEANGTDRDVQ